MQTNRGKTLHVTRPPVAGDTEAAHHAFDLVGKSLSTTPIAPQQTAVIRYSVAAEDEVGECAGLWFMGIQDRRDIEIRTAGPIFFGEGME
jgi:hypothetical protein